MSRTRGGKESTTLAIDTTGPRSRRAMLLGALAATGAGLVARVQPVNAGIDGDVVLGAGNGATTMTLIVNTTTDGQAFAAYGNGKGTGVEARSGSGYGVFGNSASGVGVYGLGDVARVSGLSTGEGKGVKGISTYRYWGVRVHLVVGRSCSARSVEPRE